MLMSGYQVSLQLSALIGFWGAYASNATFPSSDSLQWQIPVAIQLVPGILLLLGTFYIPESPRFLAKKGREGKAEKALAWLRGCDEGDKWKVGEEMDEIRAATVVSRHLGDKNMNFMSEVFKKSIRGRLVVGVGLMIAQNMVGLNALNYCRSSFFCAFKIPIRGKRWLITPQMHPSSSCLQASHLCLLPSF
jgi:MFS family permease